MHGLRGPRTMPITLDVQSWRVATRDEVLAFIQPARPNPKKVRKRGPSKRALIFRTHLRPVDVYAYLRARFGAPNGFQNALRKDDSDNWIHWDYNVRAGEFDVHIAGTSRTIHVSTREDLSDDEWKQLAIALKRDFARIGKDKSAMMASFEKWVVFQNKYVALANLCAEAHAAIVEAESRNLTLPKSTSSRKELRTYYLELRKTTSRAMALYGNCLTLRLVTPIMAEAYINMVIVMLCKDAIRNDREAFEGFVRAKIPERLELLSQHCDGFIEPINAKSDSYASFMRVMNLRNFALHGNVDPVREQLETIYFEGKRPLFVECGDNVLKVFEHQERIYKPTDIIQDYEATHAFLHEISTCLSPRHQDYFRQVISDPYPGYDLKRKRVTRLLPDHSVTGYVEGIRYDDELDVDWKAP
ncbi:hypothetical protein A1D31_36730 [Bradyrhizobium liaoningense]|nr:hypothetical protein A1D31_36730 [Bradyrhizobium liaoningense]